MSSNEEQSLIRGAQDGDREALERLWDLLTPKLFGYLINTLRDRALAEDILQATWLKAINALPQFEARAAGIGAWLFAIARNECRAHWRKSGRETPLDPALHDKPDNQEAKSDESILAEQILALLAEDDREILRLRYIADLPFKNIAEVLNINSITVRVRASRALARARAAYISKKQ